MTVFLLETLDFFGNPLISHLGGSPWSLGALCPEVGRHCPTHPRVRALRLLRRPRLPSALSASAHAAPGLSARCVVSTPLLSAVLNLCHLVCEGMSPTIVVVGGYIPLIPRQSF